MRFVELVARGEIPGLSSATVGGVVKLLGRNIQRGKTSWQLTEQRTLLSLLSVLVDPARLHGAACWRVRQGRVVIQVGLEMLYRQMRSQQAAFVRWAVARPDLPFSAVDQPRTSQWDALLGMVKTVMARAYTFIGHSHAAVGTVCNRPWWGPLVSPSVAGQALPVLRLTGGPSGRSCQQVCPRTGKRSYQANDS